MFFSSIRAFYLTFTQIQWVHQSATWIQSPCPRIFGMETEAAENSATNFSWWPTLQPPQTRDGLSYGHMCYWLQWICYILNHTLLYCLLYPQWDHNVLRTVLANQKLNGKMFTKVNLTFIDFSKFEFILRTDQSAPHPPQSTNFHYKETSF